MKHSSTITQKELAGMMDHTFLKAYAVPADFEKLCREAREYGFAMTAVNSSSVSLCKKLLEGSGVHVGAAVSFPLGQTAVETKAFETEQAIREGADEIDYVLNIGELKMGHDAYIRREMETLTGICRKHGTLIKVIFENCYLTKEEIVRAARIAREVRPDFIKTSTGFGTGGALVEDVKLMKDTAGDLVKVKAAGGIQSWDICRQMIDAGAERIGTSRAVQIMEEFLKEKEQACS